MTTLEDVADLTRLLAVTTQPDNPDRPGTNLVAPPLLAQLRTNIQPDGAGTPGNRKPASERVLVNSAALDLYQWLDRQVRAIYEQGTDLSSARRAPEELLIDWYVEIAVQHDRGEIPDTLLEQLHDRLNLWRTRIMDHFNPPERGDLPHPCPNCGWTWMTIDRADGTTTRQHALVRLLRTWRGADAAIAVRCRKCHTEWTGEEQLIELAATLGIPAGQLTDSDPEPELDPDAPLTPLHLCVMTPAQARLYARDHGLAPDEYAIAATGIGKVRRTDRPITIVRSDTYTPGPLEQARVEETLRVAALVNEANGHPTEVPA